MGSVKKENLMSSLSEILHLIKTPYSGRVVGLTENAARPQLTLDRCPHIGNKPQYLCTHIINIC